MNVNNELTTQLTLTVYVVIEWPPTGIWKSKLLFHLLDIQFPHEMREDRISRKLWIARFFEGESWLIILGQANVRPFPSIMPRYRSKCTAPQAICSCCPDSISQLLHSVSFLWILLRFCENTSESANKAVLKFFSIPYFLILILPIQYDRADGSCKRLVWQVKINFWIIGMADWADNSEIPKYWCGSCHILPLGSNGPDYGNFWHYYI